MENKIEEKNKLDKLIAQKNFIKKADIAIIIILLLIGIYVIYNIEFLKNLGGDVCKYCMAKTGAVCNYPFNAYANLTN